MTSILPLEVRFLKRFARTLHENGSNAHRLEATVRSVASALNLRCDIWSNPTGLLMAFQSLDDEEDAGTIPPQLVRLEPGVINLGRLCDVQEVGDFLLEGRLSVQAAYQRLKEPTELFAFPLWLRAMCWGLSATAVATLLGDSWYGIGAALLVGMSISVVSAFGSIFRDNGNLEAVAALLSTLIIFGVSQVVPGIEPATVIMASLIVMIPGLGLTIAVAELSTHHLTSGASRFAGAMMDLMKLTLGVFLGVYLAELFGWQPLPAEAGQAYPGSWFIWPAVLGSAFAFSVLFSARPRDFPIAMLAAMTSFAVSRLGGQWFGPEIGVLLAAMMIAILGNIIARGWHRPAALVRVPGVILLVPGSVGYQWTNEFVVAANFSGDTIILLLKLLMALVGGLLFGDTILPPRKHAPREIPSG